MTILGRIHVERFKSLYDVDVELGHVNVFIGANERIEAGAGKDKGLASRSPRHASARVFGEAVHDERMRILAIQVRANLKASQPIRDLLDLLNDYAIFSPV